MPLVVRAGGRTAVAGPEARVGVAPQVGARQRDPVDHPAAPAAVATDRARAAVKPLRRPAAASVPHELHSACRSNSHLRRTACCSACCSVKNAVSDAPHRALLITLRAACIAPQDSVGVRSQRALTDSWLTVCSASLHSLQRSYECDQSALWRAASTALRSGPQALQPQP